MGKKFPRSTQSTREIRRAHERAEQREARKRELDAFWALPAEERQRRMADNEAINRIQRNGITIEDLDKAGKDGYNDGAKQGAENTMRNIYAAVALVLHEKYGFGKKRCADVLNAVDEKVVYALDSTELINQAWDDIGLEISFDGDPLTERIHEKGA